MLSKMAIRSRAMSLMWSSRPAMCPAQTLWLRSQGRQEQAKGDFDLRSQDDNPSLQIRVASKKVAGEESRHADCDCHRT